MQEGRNAGVTGIIDVAGQAAAFAIWARAFNTELNAGEVEDGGRGDDEWPNLLPGSCTGGIVVSGLVQLSGWPMPDRWRGEPGTLTLQLHKRGDGTPVTGVYPVRVVKSTFAKPDKESGKWLATLVCRLTGPPVFGGFGVDEAGTETGQPTAAAEDAVADKILWAGLSTTVDPDGLISGAARRLRVFGLGDDDAAEKTKLDAVIAAIGLPFVSLKPRTATLTRVSDRIGLIDVAFGLTTTGEDAINQATSLTIDPMGLQSQGTTAAFNATPSAPATAPYDGGTWANRGVTTKELNDGKALQTAQWGERSTQADIEYPGSPTTTEASGIGNEAKRTSVTDDETPPAAPSAPAGQQLVASASVRQDDGHWAHSWDYGNSTAAEKIAYEGTATDVDPSGLADRPTVTIVDGAAGPPSTPSAPVSGTKLRGRRSQRVQTVPEKWRHTFEYGRRTTAEDVERPATWTKTDPSDLESAGAQAIVYGLPGSAPAATVPGGQQTVGTRVEVENDGKGVVRYEFAKDTSQQKLEQRETFEEIDPNGLRSRASAAALDGTPALPAGYKERATRTSPATHDHDMSVTEGGLTDTVDDVVLPGSVSAAAGDDAKRDTLVSVIDTASSAATYLAGIAATLYANPTFEGARVVKLTPDKARVEVTYRENVRRVMFEMRGFGMLPSLAYWDGTDVYVSLAAKIQVTSTQWAYQLGERPLRAALMRFSVEYRDTAATLPMSWALVGKTNDDTFLGIPAGFVAFAGTAGNAIVDNSGDNSGAAKIVPTFDVDSRGWIDMDGVPPAGATMYTTTDLTAVDPGWVLASDLGLTVAVLPDDDFTGVF